MKKLFVVLFVFVFAGMMMAQNNEVNIDQAGFSIGPKGVINFTEATQTGDQNSVDIDQIAGTYNTASVGQNGTNNKSTIEQNSGSWNTIVSEQNNGDNNIIWVDQDAVNGNTLSARQYNSDIYLVGANNDGTIDMGSAARQISHSGRNDLVTSQHDDAEAGLYQEADGDNYARIQQWGGTTNLVVYQKNTSVGGSNTLKVLQTTDSKATVIQNTTAGNGIVDIYQH